MPLYHDTDAIKCLFSQLSSYHYQEKEVSFTKEVRNKKRLYLHNRENSLKVDSKNTVKEVKSEMVRFVPAKVRKK